MDPHYPAAAHREVTTALIEAAERLNVRYFVGVTCCTASVLNLEMEGSAILVLARLFGVRAGGVLAVVANPATATLNYTGVEA